MGIYLALCPYTNPEPVLKFKILIPPLSLKSEAVYLFTWCCLALEAGTKSTLFPVLYKAVFLPVILKLCTVIVSLDVPMRRGSLGYLRQLVLIAAGILACLKMLGSQVDNNKVNPIGYFSLERKIN